jgi:hypothetical protein
MGKAGVYASEAPTRVGSGFTSKLERLARDKYSSLLRILVNYDHKKFCNIGPRPNIYKRQTYVDRAPIVMPENVLYKHSSLFLRSINDEEKSFITPTSGTKITKPSFS